MPNHQLDSTNPDDGATGHEMQSVSSAHAVPYSPEQFRRTAELVASGELPLPRHLPAEQRAALAREVQQRRRRRLVKFVARAIAGDILDVRQSKHGGKSNAKTSL